MNKILYCKNKPVYNIDTEQIYSKDLLPGYMLVKGANRHTFKSWFKLRYSSNANTLARQLKGIAFGQGNRVTINNETRALSLSDSYWIKSENDNTPFEKVSPYYTYFWTGLGEYISGLSVPTLYVGGYLRKEWINPTTLVKYGEETKIEYQASVLCKLCNISAVEIKLIDNGILVRNLTNPDIMLEQADESGRVDPDDFDENTIEKLFGIDGIRMLLIDAIIGNGDRHAGNFGWLRDTNTGKYLCMSPLYDFDHALDSTSNSDRLITDTLKVIEKSKEYRLEALRLSKIVIRELSLNEVFRRRAETVYNRLK